MTNRDPLAGIIFPPRQAAGGLCVADECVEEANAFVEAESGTIYTANTADEMIYCEEHAQGAAAVVKLALYRRDHPPAEPIKLSIMLNHKMGLPDYSSVEASMHVSFTQEHTDEEIVAMVERGKIAWDVMATKVTAQVRAARASKGWG